MSQDADAIADLYRRHASVWAKRRNAQHAPSKWLEHFQPLLPPKANVLDLGCGTGAPIGRHLISAGYAMTGVDSAPEMIAHAKAQFPRTQFPTVRWHVGDMREWKSTQRYQGILAWNSFFHLTHAAQRQMFARFQSLAAPEAALMFTSGPSHGIAMGEFQGEPLYHASLDPEEYKDLLSAHGFDLVAHVVEDPDCHDHTVWLARYVS